MGKARAWDARTPLLVVFNLSILVMLIDRPLTLGLLAAGSMAWAAAAGLPARQWGAVAGINVVAAWSLVMAQTLFYDGAPRVVWFTIIAPLDIGGWHFEGVHAYRAGVRHGLIQALRFTTLLTAGLTCAGTISAGALLTGLARLRVPYVLCFLTATGLRLLPVVVEEWRTVRRARRLRLAHRPPSWREATGREVAALRPVLGRALRRSATLAAALAARQFDPTRRRTSAALVTWRHRDTVVCAALAGGVVAAALSRALLLMAEWGLWRPGGLAPALAVVRDVLT